MMRNAALLLLGGVFALGANLGGVDAAGGID
eukprot:COSAG02_NODE_36688_length_451_cov_3.298295_1_plen_30_part_10